jgi:uncharacterized membrane protein
LPKGKAEILASLLKEFKAGVVETKIRGSKLTVTAIPAVQELVAQIVLLMEGRLLDAKLKISLTGPKNAVQGTPVVLNVRIKNTGKVPLKNMFLEAQFDDGLEHETKANPLRLNIGQLELQESKTHPLILTPVRTGRFKISITATADGLNHRAEHSVMVKHSE